MIAAPGIKGRDVDSTVRAQIREFSQQGVLDAQKMAQLGQRLIDSFFKGQISSRYFEQQWNELHKADAGAPGSQGARDAYARLIREMIEKLRGRKIDLGTAVKLKTKIDSAHRSGIFDPVQAGKFEKSLARVMFGAKKRDGIGIAYDQQMRIGTALVKELERGGITPANFQWLWKQLADISGNGLYASAGAIRSEYMKEMYSKINKARAEHKLDGTGMQEFSDRIARAQEAQFISAQHALQLREVLEGRVPKQREPGPGEYGHRAVK